MTYGSMQKIVKLLGPNTSTFLDSVKLACDYLNQGSVIALPTDTLYGLAAKISNGKALTDIYAIKSRHDQKPLAVCVSDVSNINDVANVQCLELELLHELLPGPVTILLPRSHSLDASLNPNVDLVGVRIPNNEFIRHICRLIGPIVLTSANKSGEKSCTKIEEFAEIWDDISLIFDQGCLSKASNYKNLHLGSTIFRLDAELRQYRVIRSGCALSRTLVTLKKFGYRQS